MIICHELGSWYMAMDAGSGSHTGSCTVCSHDVSTRVTSMALHEGNFIIF